MPPQNKPPEVDIKITGYQYPGQTIKINTLGTTDPDGSIKEMTYQYGDGGSKKTKKPEVVEHIYQSPGTYVITVTAKDNKNAVTSKTMKIGILQIGSSLIIPNQAESFDSPTGGPILVTYPDPPVPGGGIPPYTVTYSLDPAVYLFPIGTTSVTMYVIDSIGNTGQGVLFVTIVDTSVPIPPDPPDPDPIVITPPANQTVTSPEGDPVSVSWSAAGVSGGTPPYTTTYVYNGVNITSPYSFPVGANTVVIHVVDNIGTIKESSFSVTVNYTPPDPPDPPNPSVGHPRIWLNDIVGDQQSRTVIAAKINTGGFLRADYTNVVAYSAANWNTDFGGVGIWAALYYAFIYTMWDFITPPSTIGIYTDKNLWGDKANTIMLTYMATFPTVGEAEQEPAGAVYDWVNDRLTGPNKTTYANWFKTADNLTGSPNPIVVEEVSKREFIQVFANALKDDHVLFTGGGSADAWAAAHIADFSAKFRDTTGCTRLASAFGGDTGTAPLGISYDLGHMITRNYNGEDAWRTTQGVSRSTHWGGTSGVNDTRYFRYTPLHYLYRIFPFAPVDAGFPGGRQYRWEKGFYMVDGQSCANNAANSWLMWQVVAAYNGVNNPTAQLGQWLLENRIGQSLSTANYREYIGKFIYALNTVTAASPDTLGLVPTKMFDDGRFISISDWTSANAFYYVVENLKFLRDGTDHSGYNPGALQVAYNGPSIVNQGGIGSHDWGMGQYAGAVNIDLFVDRSVTHVSSLQNDSGAARRALGPGDMVGTTSLAEDSVADRRGKNSQSAADELRYFIATGGRLANYVFADVTRAYQSDQYQEPGSVEKVTSVVRQKVCFPPTVVGTDSGVFFVFTQYTISTSDRTSGQILHEQHWHTVGEPIVTGYSSTAAGPSRGDGTTVDGFPATAHTQGITTYSGGNPVITATNTVNGSNNKCFITPMQPATTVIKVWGPNGSGDNWQTASHNYESPYGLMTAPGAVPTADVQQYDALGRVEFHDAVFALTGYRLTCIEVAPSSSATITSTMNGATGTMAYAMFGNNRWVAFPISGIALTSGTLVIRCSGATSGKLFIPALGLGQRTLTPGANINIEGAGAGVAYAGANALVGSSQSIELSIAVSADGSGAANTITIS